LGVEDAAMSPLTFWLNPPETCPKCKQATVRLSYIEADNGTATLNYACDKCGAVKVKVISLKPPERPVK
jgi:transcription elongation factor Elf1